MNKRVKKGVLAGIIGTAVLTAVMMIAAMLGFPKVAPPKMLSGMLGAPIFVGWIMHFMIGTIFALSYSLFFIKLKISNIWLKGAVFGIIAFVFAQIMKVLMEAVMPMLEPDSTAVIIEKLIGHIIFGMVVAKTVGNIGCKGDTCKAENKPLKG